MIDQAQRKEIRSGHNAMCNTNHTIHICKYALRTRRTHMRTGYLQEFPRRMGLGEERRGAPPRAEASCLDSARDILRNAHAQYM